MRNAQCRFRFTKVSTLIVFFPIFIYISPTPKHIKKNTRVYNVININDVVPSAVPTSLGYKSVFNVFPDNNGGITIEPVIPSEMGPRYNFSIAAWAVPPTPVPSQLSRILNEEQDVKAEISPISDITVAHSLTSYQRGLSYITNTDDVPRTCAPYTFPKSSGSILFGVFGTAPFCGTNKCPTGWYDEGERSHFYNPMEGAACVTGKKILCSKIIDNYAQYKGIKVFDSRTIPMTDVLNDDWCNNIPYSNGNWKYLNIRGTSSAVNGLALRGYEPTEYNDFDYACSLTSPCIPNDNIIICARR